jgi:cytochrome bd-type quinol oxidase subunit 2
MPESRKRPKEREYIKQMAKSVRRRLILVISILLLMLLVLLFRVGGSYWPAWLIHSRKLLAVILAFVSIFLILLSPIIIEATSNPRALSGPGKNPKGPPID